MCILNLQNMRPFISGWMLKISIYFISSVSPFCPCTFLRFAELDRFNSLWKWCSIPFEEVGGQGGGGDGNSWYSKPKHVF